MLSEKEISAECDIHGVAIKTGSAVRSHDHAFGLKAREMPFGMAGEGPGSFWMEGEVVSIGDEVHEGCPRYRIRVRLLCRDGDIREATDADPEYVLPPVNGTPNWMGGVTCGVVAVHLPEWEGDYNSNWLELEPEHVDAVGTRDMVNLSEDIGKWWLTYDGMQGATPYDTREEASSAGRWDARFRMLKHALRMEATANLGPGWRFTEKDGVGFEHETDGDIRIRDSGMWEAWNPDGTLLGKKSRVGEAAQLVQNAAANDAADNGDKPERQEPK